MRKQLLAALVGQDAAIEQLCGTLLPLARPDAWPRSVVPIALAGPTGTGKTALVRAAAAAIGAPLIEFDGSAFGAGELRDRLRAAVSTALARPEPLRPAMRVVLIENLPSTERGGLLWLLADRAAVYVGESSAPTPLERVVLIATVTCAAGAAPLSGVDPAVARHFGPRVVVLAPADQEHVPGLIDRIAARSAVADRITAEHRTAASAAFQPAYGYAPVVDAMSATIARLQAAPAPAAVPTAVAAADAPAGPDAAPFRRKRSRAPPFSESDGLPRRRHRGRGSQPVAQVVARRFTDRVVDPTRRRSNWARHGFTADLEPAAQRLADALHALAGDAKASRAVADAPNNDARVRAILAHPTIWPLLAARSQRLPKAPVRDLILLSHGDRFSRVARGTWDRQLLDHVWTELRL